MDLSRIPQDTSDIRDFHIINRNYFEDVFLFVSCYIIVMTKQNNYLQQNNLSRDERKRRLIIAGNLLKAVVLVTWPLFVYEIFNSLYSLIDQIMVSRISSLSVSAVASVDQIKKLVSAMGGGLSAGGSIIIARQYGKGNIEKARAGAENLFTVGLVLCVVLFCCIPFSVSILRIGRVPEELIAISGGYFSLQLFEQGFILVNAMFIGIEKAKGNTSIVFKTNILMMVVKLFMNWLFIIKLGKTNLVWVELGSVLGQGAMLSIGLYTLFSKKNTLKIGKLTFSNSKKLLKMSFPVFLGRFVMQFGKVSVNALCGMYGPLTVGALSVCNNLTGLVTQGTSTFEDSEASIVSQNLGNRNMKRARKTFLVSISLCTCWGTLGYILMRYVFQDEIISLFNNKSDSFEFISAVKEIFVYASWGILALMINSAVLGLLYGFGKTFMSTVINVFRIAVRIATLLYLQKMHPDLGYKAVGLSMGISNVSIAVISVTVLCIFFINVKIKGYNGMYFSDEEPEMIEENGILVNRNIGENNF